MKMKEETNSDITKWLREHGINDLGNFKDALRALQQELFQMAKDESTVNDGLITQAVIKNASGTPPTIFLKPGEKWVCKNYSIDQSYSKEYISKGKN